MHSSNLSALSSSSNRKNFKTNSTQLHNNNFNNINNGSNKNASLNDININYNLSSHVPQSTSNYQQFNLNQQPQPTNASASSTTSSSSPRHTLIANSMANNVKQPHPVSYSALPHGVLINNANYNTNNSNMNSHHAYNHHQHHPLHQPHHLLLSGNSGSAPSIDLMSSMMPNKGEFCLIYLKH